MKQPSPDFQVLRTVTEYTRFYGLPAPPHPLLTLIDLTPAREAAVARGVTPAQLAPVVPQLYTVFLKRDLVGKLHYGHQTYDFNEGVLGFSAPGQVFRPDANLDASQVSGWLLVFHPDLLAQYPLGQKITSYNFFAYQTHEALHLSAREEAQLELVLDGLRLEVARPIDSFSQEVLVAQLEVLLTYASRFYHRQFVTRRAPVHDLLSRFEAAVAAHFTTATATPGLPTVQQLADTLHVSPAYLSDMLRALTGQGAQQHLQNALIEQAKRLLLTTSLSVKEAAFQLGFEYPAYFSRLFKSKTGLSPVAFRFSAQ
jgi:AraC family transcriptional activator of pobA